MSGVNSIDALKAQMGPIFQNLGMGQTDELLKSLMADPRISKDAFERTMAENPEYFNRTAKTVGNVPTTAGPREFSSPEKNPGASDFFILKEGDTLQYGGDTITEAEFNEIMSSNDPADAPIKADLAQVYNAKQLPNGKWKIEGVNARSVSPEMDSLLNQIGGGEGNNEQMDQVMGSVGSFLEKGSWMMPFAGMATMGIPGLIGGFALSKGMMSSTFGNMNPAMATITGSGVLGKFGGLTGINSMAMGATITQFMGLDGMSLTMKKIMRAQVDDIRDSAMISQLNNPGIPIEDLIFLFMAYMGEKYERKLREKMEEAAVAEKREREREMEKDRGRMIGGVLGGMATLATGAGLLGPGAVIGNMVGGIVDFAVQKKIEIKDQFNGNTKSATILMQEVQMLMHKWKQLNEMLSNLMKAMHDMAMTPIRNIR